MRARVILISVILAVIICVVSIIFFKESALPIIICSGIGLFLGLRFLGHI